MPINLAKKKKKLVSLIVSVPLALDTVNGSSVVRKLNLFHALIILTHPLKMTLAIWHEVKSNCKRG